MKNFKKFATTLALAGIIMMGVSNAKAGFLMSDLKGGTDTQPCTSKTNTNVDSGIIVSGLTGIIVSGLTGIFISDLREAKGCEKVDNGIMISD